MIIYVENSKDSTKRLLELINEFSEVAEYKSNIQKSVVFLHTNDKLSKKEKKNPIYNSIKINIILKNKFIQGGEICTL